MAKCKAEDLNTPQLKLFTQGCTQFNHGKLIDGAQYQLYWYI